MDSCLDAIRVRRRRSSRNAWVMDEDDESERITEPIDLGGETELAQGRRMGRERGRKKEEEETR